MIKKVATVGFFLNDDDRVGFSCKPQQPAQSKDQNVGRIIADGRISRLIS